MKKLVNRGQPSSDKAEETPLPPGGSACYYPQGAQVFLFSGPKSQSDFEDLLWISKRDKETRHPVSGLGDRAYIMFPQPVDQYQDRAAFLVTSRGQHTLGVILSARQKGETPESLQPAVTEIAKIMLAKLRD